MRIFVGNLHADLSEETLSDLFGPHGEVRSARRAVGRFDGGRRDYGFVEMPNAAQATAAITALNGLEVNGRRLIVATALNKPGGASRGR